MARAVNGPDDLRKALMARPDQFVQTLTENLMTYALGPHARVLRHADRCAQIVREAAHNDDRFSAIVLGIVAQPRVPDAAAARQHRGARQPRREQ